MKEKLSSSKNRKANNNRICHFEPSREISLFINTAKEETAIRIFTDQKILIEKKIKSRSELSEKLLIEIEKMLKKQKLKFSDLSSIFVFAGPGSYTGLRIGVTVANFLSFALSIPLYQADENGKTLSKVKNFALPKYFSGPRITQPKK